MLKILEKNNFKKIFTYYLFSYFHNFKKKINLNELKSLNFQNN